MNDGNRQCAPEKVLPQVAYSTLASMTLQSAMPYNNETCVRYSM